MIHPVPSSERLHIAFFGRTNVGKSSLINRLTGQPLAIVSEVAGTTTDPVIKAMEILPLGPVVIIDTPGIDDISELGKLRIQKTWEVLKRTDLAIVILSPEKGFSEYEKMIEERCHNLNIPIIYVINKVDLYPEEAERLKREVSEPRVLVSALKGTGIEELKGLMIKHAPSDFRLPTILGDLINPGDIVVCVIPVDKAAPKGRLILPQQMVIRNIIDNEAIAVVVKERELLYALENLSKEPSLVVTDASVSNRVASDVPSHIRVTSFSILFARYKGDLKTLVEGLRAIPNLKPGDRVLIAEACTHHPIEDDIGRVKIPRWLQNVVGGKLEFEVKAGKGSLPEDLERYKLVVHCGACMLNRKEMLSRLQFIKEKGVPVVNYGVIIAYMQGVLKRMLSPFPSLQKIVEDLKTSTRTQAHLLKEIQAIIKNQHCKI